MSKLSRLKAAAKKSIERTKKRHEEVVEKRAKVRERAAKVPKKPLNLEVKSSKKPKNATDVEGWFQVGLRKLAGDEVVVGRWTIKEKALAKRLLSTYGEELVESGVKYMCDNWEALKKRGLYGIPNVSLLWGMRHAIFTEIQMGSKKVVDRKNSDEYDADKAKGAPRMGW